MSKPNTPPPSGLEALAIEADNLVDNGQADAADKGPSEEEISEEQARQMLEAGMQAVVFGAFKMGRAFMAKRLPEIREEWTDEVISQPAQAAVPLLKKHMNAMMQLVGSSPELAAFVMSCIPLAMGVMNAIDRAEQNAARTVEATATTVNNGAA